MSYKKKEENLGNDQDLSYAYINYLKYENLLGFQSTNVCILGT